MATLFEVTLSGTYFNQQIINRWNYVSSGDPGTVIRSFGLLTAFGANPVANIYPAAAPLGKISAMCALGFNFQQLTVLAVYDPTDFLQVPFTPDYGGANVDDSPMSPVMAWGFRTNQVRRDVRRATKRFPGVPEEDVSAGGEIEVTKYGLMDAVATAMSDTLTYDLGGASLSFIPAVCAKQRYNPVTHLASPTGSAYRYYPEADGGETEQLAHTAQGVTWDKYTQVRSQVSRQYGRGR